MWSWHRTIICCIKLSSLTVLSAYARLAARGAQHLIYDVIIPAERTVRSFYGCPEDGIRLHRFRNRQDKLSLQVSHYITIPCQRHIIWMLCSTAVPSTVCQDPPGCPRLKPITRLCSSSSQTRFYQLMAHQQIQDPPERPPAQT